MTLSPSLLSDSSKTACQTRLVPAFTAAKSSTNQFLTGKHSIPRSSAYLVRRIGISQYICWVLVVQRPDMHIRIAFLRLSCPKDWDPVCTTTLVRPSMHVTTTFLRLSCPKDCGTDCSAIYKPYFEVQTAVARVVIGFASFFAPYFTDVQLTRFHPYLCVFAKWHTHRYLGSRWEENLD